MGPRLFLRKNGRIVNSKIENYSSKYHLRQHVPVSFIGSGWDGIFLFSFASKLHASPFWANGSRIAKNLLNSTDRIRPFLHWGDKNEGGKKKKEKNQNNLWYDLSSKLFGSNPYPNYNRCYTFTGLPSRGVSTAQHTFSFSLRYQPIL